MIAGAYECRKGASCAPGSYNAIYTYFPSEASDEFLKLSAATGVVQDGVLVLLSLGYVQDGYLVRLTAGRAVCVCVCVCVCVSVCVCVCVCV